ncbi:MAG: aldehyde dehydrogenase family protein, partial [Verrucomicrobia bacterium]|nr:aldehyde dehydrogenase family protein [Verrucomicrobiota bacterium]
MIQVYNPYDEKLVGEVPVLDGRQVKEAMDRGARVFADRAKWLNISQRVEILEQFRKLVIANQEKLIQQALAEGGKPLVDTKVEVARAIDGIRVAIENIPHLLGREIP